MKNLLLISIVLLSFNGFSQTTKAQRYEMYKAKCTTIAKLSIELSGFLKFDTLVLKTLPTKPTYYGKTIVNKIKISSIRSLIVVVDTIWNNMSPPVYAYGYPLRKPIVYNYDKVSYRVHKNKIFSIKLCKPVTYTLWTKNELYYEQLLNAIQTNLTL
jgi:hypothetical protein